MKILGEKIKTFTTQDLETTLKGKIPFSKISNVSEVFTDDQTISRNMVVKQNYGSSETLDTIANPIKYSQNANVYSRPPPHCGEHTHEILKEMLGKTDKEILRLKNENIIKLN